MTDDWIEKALQLGEAIERSEYRVVEYLLHKARIGAVQAAKELLGVHPSEAELIAHFQKEVHRYHELVDWIKAASELTEHAYRQLNDEDKAAVWRDLGSVNDQ
jgi:hypothetical protein